MSSVYDGNLTVSIFGQSHAPAIGVTIDGLPAGLPVDLDALGRFLRRRAPGQNAWSTPRKEADLPEFLCGLKDGRTCGAPLTAIIRNTNTRSGDYENLMDIPRPGHADYTAQVKFGGAQDAAEVGGGAEIAHPDGANAEDAAAKPMPDYVLDAQPTLPFSYVSPLDGALTSGFGWREDPNTGEEAFHTGLDLAADEGTPFACFADGTVGVVGESTVLGKYLTVRHADGYETLYAHCSKITVSSGQSVLRGDTLGAVGATGNATGAHLHFELLSGSKYLDPIAYAAKTV